MGYKRILLATAITATLFAQCKKDKSNNDYSFGCSTGQDSVALTVVVNGQNKGTLPYVDGGLDDCSDARGLHFSLPLGTHHVVVLNPGGDTIVEAHPLIESDDVTANVMMGSSSMVSFNRCVTWEMGY